jgi:Na+/proline symporter
MSIHPFDVAVISAYVVVTLSVGLTVGRRVKTARDFFLAGRALA